MLHVNAEEAAKSLHRFRPVALEQLRELGPGGVGRVVLLRAVGGVDRRDPLVDLVVLGADVDADDAQDAPRLLRGESGVEERGVRGALQRSCRDTA